MKSPHPPFLRIFTLCLLGMLLAYAVNPVQAQRRSAASNSGRAAADPAPAPARGQDAPPAGETPARPTAAPRAADTHVLSPGDTIKLAVFNEPRLTDEQTVSKTGDVSFQLIGTVRVGGKTLKAAEKHITQLYNADYLVNPQVTLTLAAYAEHFVTVSGAVAKPGAVPIPQEGAFDILAAIAGAGGTTEKADLRAVILRNAGGGRAIPCDVAAMQENPGLVREVRSGDTITVPTKIDQFVSVAGEVNKPGQVKIPDDGRLDVLTAITMAGDFNKFANPKRIVVNRGGKIFELNGEAMSRGTERQFNLLPDDMIRVIRRKL